MDAVYQLDRMLLLHYMDIDDKLVHYKLSDKAKQNMDIDLTILEECFMQSAKDKWETQTKSETTHSNKRRRTEDTSEQHADEMPDDLVKIAQNKAINAYERMKKVRSSLTWLFKNGSNFGTDYEKLMELEKSDKTQYEQVRKMHLEVIKKCRYLKTVSHTGVANVDNLGKLLFASKDIETDTIAGRIEAKVPCTSVFSFKTAMFIWQGMGKDQPPWENLIELAFMMTIVERAEKEGELCFDVTKKDANGELDIATDMVRKRLWQSEKENVKKDFDGMVNNELSLRKRGKTRFGEAVAEIQSWLTELVDTEEGAQRLAGMAVPMCVDKRIIYTQVWYRIHTEYLKDIDHYMKLVTGEGDGEKVEYKASFCPVCLEEFKNGGDDESDVKKVRAEFTECGHAFCRSCFNQFKIVKKNKDGEVLRKCPICRADTYLRAINDSEAFLQWYNDNKNAMGFTFSKEQLDPIIALLKTKRGLINVNGAGGTGKSELVSLLAKYDIFVREQLEGGADAVARAVFVAPTGTAAVNMKKRLPCKKFQVSTIHSWALILYHRHKRLIEASRQIGCLDENMATELAVPFLFVDEAAMVGAWLMSCVFRLARITGIKRIVLLGDRYQLPPVNAIGSLFASCCLSSKQNEMGRVFPLTHCYRSGVKGINHLLQRIRDVMKSLEHKQLHGTFDGTPVLSEKDFKCNDSNISVKLMTVQGIEGNATCRQEELLESVRNVLSEFSEKHKTADGAPPKLSDTTCVITDKRSKAALLELSLMNKSAIDKCSPVYNDILKLLNPERAQSPSNTNRGTKRNRAGDTQAKDFDRFVVGDCVMCLENVRIDNDNRSAKELVLCNGSQGHVTSVTYGDGLKGATGRLKYVNSMVVNFDGQEYCYPVSDWYPSSKFYLQPQHNQAGDEANERGNHSYSEYKVNGANFRNQELLTKMFKTLTLGSIQTVHKYQGSQKDNVVVVMFGGGKRNRKVDDFHTMNMLYTAVSRAKKCVRIVMDQNTLKHFLESPTLAQQDTQLIRYLDGL